MKFEGKFLLTLTASITVAMMLVGCEKNAETKQTTDKPTAKAVDNPTKQESEKPAENKAAKPAEKPADAPKAAKPAEKPADAPKAAKPAEKPADAPKAAKPAEKPADAPKAEAKDASAPKVLISTSMGDITVQLDPKAPISVKNFLSYVESGFYSGTVFHRIIKTFMIQGGGFTADMQKKATNPPIKLETGKGLSNLRGTLAMARTNNPNSASSQFFINVVDNLRLDTYGGGYAVFGKVISGMDVVDKIKAVATGVKNGMPNVPLQPVVIKSMKKL